MRGHHFSRGILLMTAVVVTGLGLVGSARGGQFTEIVSFGDSLSDVGNFYKATGGVSPPALYGYDQGRFANGPMWLDYLAKDLGLAAPTASLNGGLDYAYGGATTGPGDTTLTFPSSGPIQATATVPNIDGQIASFLGSHTPTPGQIFTIWGGANDFLNAGQTNPLIPAQNIADEIITLAIAGAKTFLVPNLPLLGALPSTSSLPWPIPQELDELTVAFNTALQTEATQLEEKYGLQINLVDVYSLTNDAMANPSKYGFANVTDSALLSGSNGDGYLFWDIVHPTTQADAFIGGLAAQSVPEPSSLIMLGSALIIVGRLTVSRLRKPAIPEVR
jgi:phospholipase/lecithinase/hemolysin